MNTYSNLDMKVKQLNSFNEIVEPIYQNFDKKYQDILLDLVNNWLKNNDFDKKLLADYVEELMNEYSEYQSSTNKWNNVRKINGNGFDNC
jgi:light-regulated signal transduction histidine kinase (bacteriophytochrome)